MFRTPPNALRIEWQSAPGGTWDAQIHLVNFPNRYPELSGGTLYFWMYSPEPIAAADLPGVVLSDAREGLQVATMPGSFTVEEPLASYTGDLPAEAMGAGTHSTREAALGVRVSVPPGATAKHHLSSAARGWRQARADRRRHSSRR